MDKLNASFQELIEERGFRLKVENQSKQICYKGCLALEESLLIDFAIRIPCSDGREVVQIVFDNIAQCPSQQVRSRWLEYLNTLNHDYGIHYYFSMKENGSIFARYLLPVDPDRTEVVLELIQIGGHLVRQLRLDQLVFE